MYMVTTAQNILDISVESAAPATPIFMPNMNMAFPTIFIQLDIIETVIGSLELPDERKRAADALYRPMNGNDRPVISIYTRAFSMTSASTLPNMSDKSGARNITHIAEIAVDIVNIDSMSCLPAAFALSVRCFPIYCEQTMAPPVASAEKMLSINVLIESTSDTAEIAAEPTLLTIIVSAVPISELSTCSTISGMRSAQSCFFVNMVVPRKKYILPEI